MGFNAPSNIELFYKKKSVLRTIFFHQKYKFEYIMKNQPNQKGIFRYTLMIA